MISTDDIEAFTPDDMAALETADAIVDRSAEGATNFRRILPDEELPLIRAFAVMRWLAKQQADILSDLHARQMAGMDVAPDQHRG